MNHSHETLKFASPAKEFCSKDDYCGNDASCDYFSPSNNNPITPRLMRSAAAFGESDASLDYAGSSSEARSPMPVVDDSAVAGQSPALRFQFDGLRTIADDGSWDYSPHSNAFGLAS